MDRLLRRAPRPPKGGEDGAGYTPLQALEQGSRRPGYGATHQHDQDQDQRQSFCEFDHQISVGARRRRPSVNGAMGGEGG